MYGINLSILRPLQFNPKYIENVTLNEDPQIRAAGPRCQIEITEPGKVNPNQRFSEKRLQRFFLNECTRNY